MCFVCNYICSLFVRKCDEERDQNRVRCESGSSPGIKHTPWRKGDARKISLGTPAYPSLLDIDEISVPPHCWMITIQDV